MLFFTCEIRTHLHGTFDFLEEYFVLIQLSDMQILYVFQRGSRVTYTQVHMSPLLQIVEVLYIVHCCSFLRDRN
jgi:hypothetical protein